MSETPKTVPVVPLDELHNRVSISSKPLARGLVKVQRLPLIGDVGCIISGGEFATAASQKYTDSSRISPPLKYLQHFEPAGSGLPPPITSKGVHCKLDQPEADSEEMEKYRISICKEIHEGAVLIPLESLKRTSVGADEMERLRSATKENAFEGPGPGPHSGLDRRSVMLVHSYVTIDSWVLLTFKKDTTEATVSIIHSNKRVTATSTNAIDAKLAYNPPGTTADVIPVFLNVFHPSRRSVIDADLVGWCGVERTEWEGILRHGGPWVDGRGDGAQNRAAGFEDASSSPSARQQ